MSKNAVCARIKEKPRDFISAVRKELRTHTDLSFAGENSDLDYITTICYFIENPEDTQTAQDMGAHQRIYGDISFISWAAAVNTVIRQWCTDLDFTLVYAAERAIIRAAKIMQESGEKEAELSWRARIVDIVKPCRRVSIVRLLSEKPIPYTAGQFLPYSTTHAFDGSPTGDWRYAHAAIPPNESNQLEFHIFHDLDDIRRPHVGDWWIIGPGMGNLFCSGTRDILMLAQDTAVAGAQSMLLSLSNFANPPRVHLFYAAQYPGELYALRTLWHIASSAPWLSVTPISEEKQDTWWVNPTASSQPPRGLHLHQVGLVEEIVSSYGSWDDRDILLFGSRKRTNDMAATLNKGGTPLELIQRDTIR